MNMNFSDADNGAGDFELIPAGTLLWAYVNVRSIEQSGAGNEYLDIELTGAEGPYARRKIWDMIGIGGSEKYVNIGRSQIKAILESGRGAGPDNPTGYQIQQYQDLNNLKVPIKIKVEKGGTNPAGGNYADKNRPIYLSPNPNGGTVKAFNELLAQASKEPQSAPTQAQQPPAPQAPAWAGSAATNTSPAAAELATPIPIKPAWL